MKSLLRAQLITLLESAYVRGTSDMDEMQQFIQEAKRHNWPQARVEEKAEAIAARREGYFQQVADGV